MNISELLQPSAGILDKEVHELTNQDRLAICAAAGCELETVNDGVQPQLRTRYPVTITKADGRFLVTEDPRNR